MTEYKNILNPEIHLFVIWEKGLGKQSEIEADIKNSFDLLDTFRVTWPVDQFSVLLSRFYGENLPKNSHKERHCGNGPFGCYVVRDANPNYQLRKTSKGIRLVNVNLFDKKAIYRKWTNHGHLIHATDNISETRTQLFLLTSQSYSYYLTKPRLDTVIYKEITSPSIKTLDDIFLALNATVNYVVLRNYDSLVHEINSEHPDIDLLTDEPDTLARVLGAQKKFTYKHSVQYKLVIASKEISLDIRSTGDDYYCELWQRNILRNRRSYKNLYIPNSIDHFYSLLYHALLHKKELSPDYHNRLKIYADELKIEGFKHNMVEKDMLNLLIKYMDQHNYRLCEPHDLSVFWNHALAQSFFPMPMSKARERSTLKNKIKRKIRYRIKKILGLNIDKYKNN